MNDLSIVIVSLNVKGLLCENLVEIQNLLAQERVSGEIFVVDNGSIDGTAEEVRERFPGVKLIANGKNTGFAYACNQGLRQAKGDVCLLLNPDMRVLPGALRFTVDELRKRKEIGVLGIRLVREDGTQVASVRRDPGFIDQFAILSKISLIFPSLTKRYLAEDMDYTRSQEVDQVRGSFFAFRRELLETVGYLDSENFFVWFEEVDFCKRVREKGYKVWYEATVRACDFVGRTFAQQPGWMKQMRFSRSMMRYFWKWHMPFAAILFALIRPFAIAAVALGEWGGIKRKKLY